MVRQISALAILAVLLMCGNQALRSHDARRPNGSDLTADIIDAIGSPRPFWLRCPCRR